MIRHLPLVVIASAAGVIAASGLPQTRALAAPDMHDPALPLPPRPALDRVKVAIGERLFFDPRLSAHGRVSCRSCHDVTTNGASANRLDPGDDGAAIPLNTPTVFNSVLNFRFSWTGHFSKAPDMILGSLHNPHTMGGDGPGIRRLRGDPGLAAQVRATYHRDLDEAAATDALDVYLRSLTTPGARFDRWLAGDTGALTPQEQRGWARFQSVGCVSCHQGINVGGNIFQRHGIFHPLASPNPAILRVPSLRNVATTAPYFHDGSAPDLSSAILSMARAQLDITLSPRDVADITAFLKTLTGTYKGRPVQAPKR